MKARTTESAAPTCYPRILKTKKDKKGRKGIDGKPDLRAKKGAQKKERN